jgi:hypothetical protein
MAVTNRASRQLRGAGQMDVAFITSDKDLLVASHVSTAQVSFTVKITP